MPERRTSTTIPWSAVATVHSVRQVAILHHLAEDVLQDAAVLVIGDREGRFDPGDGAEHFRVAVCIAGDHFHLLARFEFLRQALDVEGFEPGQAERFRIFTWQKFEWQDPHADEVATVNALEAFCEDGADAEQNRSLSRPVAR